MTVATDRSKAFFTIYNGGLKDEAFVKAHLTSTGRKVVQSTMEEDKFQDIDCYVDGVAVSIKTQRSAVKYGTIGFELTQQLTERADCATTRAILANREISLNDIKRLEASGSWEKSWFYNGKAEEYYIYTGEVLRIYRKVDILDHIEKYGYKRVRALRAETKATQGGKYRYCNAISGYLDIRAVKNRAELIDEVQYN